MNQFLQFDISDFLNEMKEPLFLMDSSEILFFNRYFQENFFGISDDWKSYFTERAYQQALSSFFEGGSAPSVKVEASLQSKDGELQVFEWSFINLPSSYSSKFLVAKGTLIRRDWSGITELNKVAYYESIMSNGYDMITILDAEGNYKFISESTWKRLGFAPEEIIGQNFQTLIDHGVIEFVKGSFQEILESEKETQLDIWINFSNGRKVYLECFAKNLLHHPLIQGVIFNSRDITEFIETERSLSRRYEIENLINQISTLLINGGFIDLEEQFDLALGRFGEFFGAEYARISIINRESKELEIISFWKQNTDEGEPILEGPRYFSLINSIRGELEKSQVKVVQAASGALSNQHIFIPMSSEDKLMGMVQLEISRPRFALIEKELQVLRQLGDILAGAYLGSLMTRKLERNENLLATTEQLSNSGSWRYSAFRDLFFLSGGLTRLLGIGKKAQTLATGDFMGRLDAEYRTDFVENLKKASEEICRTSGEFSLTDLMGQKRYFSYEIEGKKEYFSKGTDVFGFCTDITEKRSIDRHLKLQSQILTQVHDPILVTNNALDLIYLNEAAVRLCGAEKTENFRGNIESLVDFNWEKGENLLSFVQNLNPADSWGPVRYIKTNNSELLPFEISAQAIYTERKERIGYSFVLRSLAEKYQAEEIAKRAQHIVENSPAVLFRINPNKGYKIKYISQNISQFGYSADELMANGVRFSDLVYEEDLNKILKELENSNNVDFSLAYSGEYRIIKADGTLVWVEDKAKAVYDEEAGGYIHEGIFQDISDRKNLEAIKASRDLQYRMLAANIPDINIFLVDANRNYLVAEGTNFEKWGLKREDFEGKNLREVQLTAFEEINPILDRVFLQKEIVTSEFFVKERFFQRIIRPIEESGEVKYALSIVRDIHEEYQAKQDLLRSEEKYRRLVEESTEIIFSLTETFLLNYVSPNVSQFLEYDSAEVIGRSIFDFIHLDDLGVFQEMLLENENFLAENQFLEFRLRHKNGEYRVFNSNGKLIEDKDGIHRYYTGVARDISKLKEAQRELVIAKERAEQASLVKSQFLSVMSHEIRTPMNAVIGLAHFLMEENPRPDQLENLKTLQFSAENLMALINDILDYNKIDSGKVELESAAFDVRNMIHRIIHSHSFLANEKGLKLSCVIDEGIPETLIGDSLRLGQVINNLVSNAIKFTERGHVKITLSREFFHKNECEIKFEFEDSGIGIPEAKRAAIFEAFTQASSSTSRKYGGTGLGLAIVKRLVELFGGEIGLRSRPGGGSIFEFTLMFEFVSEEKIREEKIQEQYKRSLEQSSILVAEDNSVNQILIKKFLKKWNVKNLVVAADGREALNEFEHGEFDLILLDLQMPEIDGFGVAESIRNNADPLRRDIPIIALTAASYNEVKGEMVRTGIDDYVPKPFTPEGLYEKIIKFLHRKDEQ